VVINSKLLLSHSGSICSQVFCLIILSFVWSFSCNWNSSLFLCPFFFLTVFSISFLFHCLIDLSLKFWNNNKVCVTWLDWYTMFPEYIFYHNIFLWLCVSSSFWMYQQDIKGIIIITIMCMILLSLVSALLRRELLIVMRWL
jgi:hypothetical protein